MGYSAWRTPDSGYAIRCCGLGECYDGSTGWPAGAFLAEYDPEAHDGHGEMWWTEDINRAISFPDIEGAIECYRAVPANRPVREDGKPNCPLTVFTVEFVDLPNPRPFDPANDRHHVVSGPAIVAALRAGGLLDEGPPDPAPPPRQVESEADFLKRLSRIRAEAEAKQAASAITPSEADELRAMGLM